MVWRTARCCSGNVESNDFRKLRMWVVRWRQGLSWQWWENPPDCNLYSWIGCENNCPLGNDHISPTTSQHVYVWVDYFPAFPFGGIFWLVCWREKPPPQKKNEKHSFPWNDSSFFWYGIKAREFYEDQGMNFHNIIKIPQVVLLVTLKYPTIKSHLSFERVTHPSLKGHKQIARINKWPFWDGENVTLSKENRNLQRSGIKFGHEFFITWKETNPRILWYQPGQNTLTYPDYKHTTACQELPGLNSFAILLVGFSWIFGVNSRQKPTTTSGKSKLLQAHLSTEQQDKVPVKQVWNCRCCCNTLFAFSRFFFQN